MTEGILTTAYIAAGILFILALGGLSHQETARRGNVYGIIGMAIALIAVIASEFVTNYAVLAVCIAIAAVIGIYVARRVQMTQMPELVAILHSFVGLAAVLIGFAIHLDPTTHFEGPDAEVAKTIHEVEIYLGVLIGAVTFTGSVIAFGKLSARISSKPLALPARHWLNLGLGLVCLWLGFVFVGAEDTGSGLIPLLVMTIIAFAFGVHMVICLLYTSDAADE